MKKFLDKIWNLLLAMGQARYNSRIRNGIRYY